MLFDYQFHVQTCIPESARVLIMMVIPGQLIFLYFISYVKAGHSSITPRVTIMYITVAFIQVSLQTYGAIISKPTQPRVASKKTWVGLKTIFKLFNLYTKNWNIWPENKLPGPEFRLLPENWHPYQNQLP